MVITDFESARQINVYSDGVKTSYAAGSAPFSEIIASWNEMTEGARQMPAYGVSLHAETLKAMQKGVWAEFDFGKTKSSGGMTFERLLIEVQKSFSGFNLIRYNSKGGYDGRCYYLSLVGMDMGGFYRTVTDLE